MYSSVWPTIIFWWANIQIVYCLQKHILSIKTLMCIYKDKIILLNPFNEWTSWKCYNTIFFLLPSHLNSIISLFDGKQFRSFHIISERLKVQMTKFSISIHAVTFEVCASWFTAEQLSNIWSNIILVRLSCGYIFVHTWSSLDSSVVRHACE